MAFELTMEKEGTDWCDKCKKPASGDRPLYHLYVSGRRRMEREFITIHADCLERSIAKAKAESEESAQG